MPSFRLLYLCLLLCGLAGCAAPGQLTPIDRKALAHEAFRVAQVGPTLRRGMQTSYRQLTVNDMANAGLYEELMLIRFDEDEASRRLADDFARRLSDEDARTYAALLQNPASEQLLEMARRSSRGEPVEATAPLTRDEFFTGTAMLYQIGLYLRSTEAKAIHYQYLNELVCAWHASLPEEEREELPKNTFHCRP